MDGDEGERRGKGRTLATSQATSKLQERTRTHERGSGRTGATRGRTGMTFRVSSSAHRAHGRQGRKRGRTEGGRERCAAVPCRLESWSWRTEESVKGESEEEGDEAAATARASGRRTGQAVGGPGSPRAPSLSQRGGTAIKGGSAHTSNSCSRTAQSSSTSNSLSCTPSLGPESTRQTRDAILACRSSSTRGQRTHSRRPISLILAAAAPGRALALAAVVLAEPSGRRRRRGRSQTLRRRVECRQRMLVVR